MEASSPSTSPRVIHRGLAATSVGAGAGVEYAGTPLTTHTLRGSVVAKAESVLSATTRICAQNGSLEVPKAPERTLPTGGPTLREKARWEVKSEPIISVRGASTMLMSDRAEEISAHVADSSEDVSRDPTFSRRVVLETLGSKGRVCSLLGQPIVGAKADLTRVVTLRVLGGKARARQGPCPNLGPPSGQTLRGKARARHGPCPTLGPPIVGVSDNPGVSSACSEKDASNTWGGKGSVGGNGPEDIRFDVSKAGLQLTDLEGFWGRSSTLVETQYTNMTEAKIHECAMALIASYEKSETPRQEAMSKKMFDEVIIEAQQFVAQGNGVWDPSTALEFDIDAFEHTTAAIREKGLSSVFASSADNLRWPGENEREVRTRFESFPYLDEMMVVMGKGQPCFIDPIKLGVNGADDFVQSKSYRENSAKCNHSLNTMAKDGRALIFDIKGLMPEDAARIHFSPLQWAEKEKKPVGRTCINPSKKGKTSCESVNSATDRDASDRYFPPLKLPNLKDICELLCRIRAESPDEDILCTTVDVTAAYNQQVHNYEMGRFFCTQLRTAIGWVIVAFLVSIFGYTRAGHLHCLFACALDFAHNRGRDLARSVTYIDDTGIFTTEKTHEKDVREFLVLVTSLFGEGGLNDKLTAWGQYPEMIGWKFNLLQGVWKVAPKPRGLLKMLGAVFVRIPVGATQVEREILESVTSLFIWYAVALPLVSPFLRSMSMCVHADRNRGKRFIELDGTVRRDLDWLRVVVIACRFNPHLMTRNISHLRVHQLPTIDIYTDACLTIGGGGWWAEADGMEPKGQTVIRWTTLELELIRVWKVSINVLEFFTAVYYLLVLGPTMKGTVMHLWSDNGSTVAWVNKMRAAGGVGARLAQLLCLCCVKWDISLSSSHIAGVKNVFADELSRLPRYALDCACPEPQVALEGGEWWQSLSRQEVCRRLFVQLLVQPHEMPTLLLLSLAKVVS